MHKRLTFLLALTVAMCSTSLGQEHSVSPKSKPATLMTGFGDWHHPVSTENARAQAFFDQGLRLIYAFNHDEAARSFRRAAELDPKMAMAYWCIAEAVGPNYNDPASEDRYVQAHHAIEQASSLAEEASASDRAYIAALATRFPADPKSDLRAAAEEYRDTMRQVMLQFPDDLDGAGIFLKRLHAAFQQPIQIPGGLGARLFFLPTERAQVVCDFRRLGCRFLDFQQGAAPRMGRLHTA